MKILGLLLIGLVACSEETSIMYDYGDGNIESNYAQGAPPKDGWQQSGVLHTADNNKQVSLAADFVHSNAYTIQFDIEPPASTTVGNQIYFAIAEINWLTEGGLVRRVISVGNGSSITGIAQGVNVKVYDATPSSQTPVGGLDYTVRISVAKGSRPSQNQPPQYFRADTDSQQAIAAGANVTIDIPQNAGVISAEINFARDGAVADPTLCLVDQLTGLNIYKTYNPINYPGFVPLAPGALQIRLRNGGPTNATVSVTWGIDG